MAKIKSGILGPVSGRIGGVVGAKWKDVPVLRSYPISVANPDTPAQQNQRGKFGQCVSVARLLLADLIHVYWDPFSRTMSGFNHFIQVNIDAFGPESLISPSDFYSARGVLSGILNFRSTIPSGGNVIGVTYDNNSGVGDALVGDRFRMLYYNKTKDYWAFYAGDEVRDADNFDVYDPRIGEDDVVHTWGFFSRPDISKVSDSTYFLAEH